MSPNETKLLRGFAELRVRNQPLDACAKRLKKRAADLDRLTEKYPDAWADCRRQAERRLGEETLVECVHVLRALLRSEEEKTRQACAKILTDLILAWQPGGETADAPPESRLVRLARRVETLDEPTLQSEIDRLLAGLAAGPGPAALGGSGGRPERLPGSGAGGAEPALPAGATAPRSAGLFDGPSEGAD